MSAWSSMRRAKQKFDGTFKNAHEKKREREFAQKQKAEEKAQAAREKKAREDFEKMGDMPLIDDIDYAVSEKNKTLKACEEHS